MKRIFLAFLAMAFFNVNAQTTAGGGDLGASGIAQNMSGQGLTNTNGFVIKNPTARRVEGTYYLYNDWDNFCEVVTTDKQRYGVRNVNLNIKRSTVEAKFSGDSIFVFNYNNIEKFVINGDTFKNYYWDDDNKLYQVVYERNDLQLLKGFKVNLVEGSANPMLNRANDRYVRKEYYFVRENGKIRKFKLKKSKILKLVGGDKAKADEILNYAKQNRLSFSKENDVKKILEYSSNGRN